MPGNTYYWNSAEFESDESLTNNFPKTPYVDPWDLENYAYIREHLDSLELNSDTSSFGEPVEASSFYYAPNFDSLIESEYGTAKYAEIEEIYDQDAKHFNEGDKKLEGLYGVPSLGLNYGKPRRWRYLTLRFDREVSHNKPDIVIINKLDKHAVIIDVAVPLSTNIIKTENEKRRKYEALAIEMMAIWNLTKIYITPIVISATGVISCKFESYLTSLNLNPKLFVIIQRAVLLQTCHIVRKFFNLN
ncbi:hypothetical protein RI129_005743 [Pyrocoelia pectoralis]|uniref:Uncharacterized protein n=1 Tax=Pyrocoelia pectoralis TaxID=417401 RepID=A0AAN7VCT2_9COLE